MASAAAVGAIGDAKAQDERIAQDLFGQTEYVKRYEEFKPPLEVLQQHYRDDEARKYLKDMVRNIDRLLLLETEFASGMLKTRRESDKLAAKSYLRFSTQCATQFMHVITKRHGDKVNPNTVQELNSALKQLNDLAIKYYRNILLELEKASVGEA